MQYLNRYAHCYRCEDVEELAGEKSPVPPKQQNFRKAEDKHLQNNSYNHRQ